MTNKTKAAIEEAAKLPTAEEFFIVHAPSKNIPPDFYVNEIVELMESHTAAHTAALRERVKELEAKIASYESAIDGLKKVVDSLYKLKSL